MTMRLLKAEPVRFGLVSVAGLAVDVSIAWGLATFVGLSLVVAALIGFLAAAALNYSLHEFWTFSAAASKASARRGISYLAVVTLTLGARLAAVALLERHVLGGHQYALATLLIATAVSFVVNYALSKYVVFKRSPSATPF